jgi:hypothetical protein
MDSASSREDLFERLALLYADMERVYDEVADRIALSCDRCPDNCCDSYFHHHTRIEWAYLWEGLACCSEEKRGAVVSKAKAYLHEIELLQAQGQKPNVMCPLNDGGLCRFYKHRLMICRMHGVPNCLVRPDGKALRFPGCVRSQALCKPLKEIPYLDRTDLYRRLASLEMEFLGANMRALPRANLTIAEMIVQGPPRT